MGYSLKEPIFILEKGGASTQGSRPEGILLRVLAGEQSPPPSSFYPATHGEVRLTLDAMGGVRCQRFAGDGAFCELAHQRERQDGVRLVLSEEGLELFFGLMPWHEAVDPRAYRTAQMRHYAYVAFCGWSGGVWHDGPLYFQMEGDSGQESFCLEGGNVRLQVTSVSGRHRDDGVIPAEWPTIGDDMLPFSFRSSLVTALHEAFGDLGAGDNALALRWGEPDLATALWSLWLRMSWPDMHFHLMDPPTHLPTWCYWRRLCQNLGIDFGQAHRKLVPTQSLDFSGLPALLPASRMRAWADHFNRITPVIPLDLLKF